MKKSFLFAFCFCAGSIVRLAHADEWTKHPLALEAQAGLGAPLGFAGLAVDYSPLLWLSLNAGVGLATQGPQAAIGGRFRWALTEESGFALGVGSSVGNYHHPRGGWLATITDPENVVTEKWNPAYWVNVDVSYEHRFSSRFYLRSFGGLGYALNDRDSPCLAGAGSENTLTVAQCNRITKSQGRGPLPYLGLAVGRAF